MSKVEYKDVDLYSIKSIPKDWSLSRLKNVSQVMISNVDKKSVENEQAVYLCNYTDVYYNDKIDSTMKFMKATAKASQINKFMLWKNDVIITKDSEAADDIGIPTWVSENFKDVVCGYHLSLIRPDKDKINGRYLYYCLTSPGFSDHFSNYANGVTRYGISKDPIKNTPVLLPNLDIQRSIANFLDQKTTEIDDLIAEKEKLIQLLEEKRQAIITEVVTKGLDPDVKMKDSGVEWIGEIPGHWQVKKMKYLSTYISSGKTPRGGAEVYSSEGIPFLRSMNIHFKGLKLDNLVYVDEKIDEEMASSRVLKDDILLNITGASIGRSCRFTGELKKANVNQHVCIIRPTDQISSNYLEIAMKSSLVSYQIDISNNGSSREGLNFSQVKKIAIPMPPSQLELEKISNYAGEMISEIDEVIIQIKRQSKKIKEYRQSLIYEAVTGKIDVREMFGETELEEVSSS